MKLRSVATLDPDESFTSHYRRTLAMSGLKPEHLRRYSKAIVEWERPSVYGTEDRLIRGWSRLTSLPASAIRATTMSRYAIAIPELALLDQHTHVLPQVARMTWIWPGAAQACPQCLEETGNRWKLEWRLPYIYDCTVHRTLLRTHCPACSKLLREAHECLAPDAPFQTSWNSGKQTNGSYEAGQRLRAALSNPDTIVWSGRAASFVYLRAIRSLTGLMEHLERVDTDASGCRRAVVAAPREVERRATLFARADALLVLSPQEAADQLRSQVASVPVAKGGLHTWLKEHSLANELVEPILDEVVSRRRSIGRRRDPQAGVESRHIPQLLWPDVWEGLRAFSDSSESTGRCFASMALVKMKTGCTWPHAGLALGLSPRVTSHVSRQGKLELNDEGAFASRLSDSEPSRLVDWRRREALALILMKDASALRLLAHELRSPHLELLILRERIWIDWVLGHPTVPRRSWDVAPEQLVRAANQRRRWRPDQTVALQRWLDLWERKARVSANRASSRGLTTTTAPRGER